MLFRVVALSSRNYCRKASTVDAKEIEHFAKYADQWWDVNGPLKLLHSMNKIRVPVIRDQLLQSEMAKERKEADTTQLLKGFTILDAGCGAGLLTEALARMESKIVGLDCSADLIEHARLHAEKQNLRHLEYICSTIEDYSEKFPETYDCVIVSETIEHLVEKKQFLEAAVRCVKPGGLIFMSSNQKSWMSTFVNIFLAEYVFGIITKDTHHSDKFISRVDLEKMLEKENCTTFFRRGMFYNPITNRWITSKHFDFLWYMIFAVKHKN